MSLSFADLVNILWGQPGVRLFVAVGGVVALVLAWGLTRRLGGSFTLAAVTLASQAVLLAVTLVPDLGRGSWRPSRWWTRDVSYCLTTWDGSAQRALGTLDGRANILLFAVPTLLGMLWLHRPLVVVLVLVAESAVIELAQGAVAGTSCQASDWIANSLGASLGVALGMGVLGAPRLLSTGLSALSPTVGGDGEGGRAR